MIMAAMPDYAGLAWLAIFAVAMAVWFVPQLVLLLFGAGRHAAPSTTATSSDKVRTADSRHCESVLRHECNVALASISAVRSVVGGSWLPPHRYDPSGCRGQR